MTDTADKPPRAGHEAHVQVLTAEVRTLVIGSRQVTKTVYDQLDMVPPGAIEPFGRVNWGETNQKIWIVGRHTTTGALVRSFVFRRSADLDGDGYLYEGRVGASWTSRTRYRFWRSDVDVYGQRQHLTELVKQWSALPLIVLAGLR